MKQAQGRIEPLALVLLTAFVLLPPVLLFGPSPVRHFQEPPAPLYQVREHVPGSRRAAPPTKGMSLSASQFGTVLDAPPVAVAMDDTRSASTPANIAPDVARFVRSWPGITRNPKVDRSIPRVCAFEDGERRGRVVVRDGCLRFQPSGEAEELALLAASGTLFRDDGGYLALGDPNDPGPFQVRIGEPGVVVRTGSCAFPDTVPPPPIHRQVCGGDAMLVAIAVERRPMCATGYLADRARREREEDITAARIKAEADACHAAGRKACPPGVIPRSPPLTDAFAPCRLPSGYR